MIQYAFARRLAAFLPPSELVGVELPEWGIVSPPAPDRPFANTIVLTDFTFKSFAEVAAQITGDGATSIEIRGFFQNIDLLPDRASLSSSVFPASGKFAGRFGPGDLVINIRAGEILAGVPWYPIVPIAFYEELVAASGLSPIFVGQVGPSLYGDALREAFPQASFIGNGAPMDDFELVRSAKNICIAVSTFSWLAAWLSEADQVFYPVHGCLHPSLSPCYAERIAPTNLVPVQEARYRFYLFPLIYGLEQRATLDLHRKVGRCWRAVPATQIAYIRDHAPFLPDRGAKIGLNPIWYAHTYPDAALGIAEGWYRTPQHHYDAIGRQLGYQPAPPLTVPEGPNLSAGQWATQSSVSAWSVGQTAEADAGRAVDGQHHADFAFHTDVQEGPWWLCDLGTIHMIEWINIYNRSSTHAHIRLRALPLLVEGSMDGVNFEQIRLVEHYHDFGSRDVGPVPLQIAAPSGIAARFIRLTAQTERTCLHLSEVAIFGFADAPCAPPEDLSTPVWPNVALDGIAAQSSHSDWSRGTPAEEAQRPVLAAPGLEFSFHTAAEHRPWWRDRPLLHLPCP